jgi:hypothetical protein
LGRDGKITRLRVICGIRNLNHFGHASPLT